MFLLSWLKRISFPKKCSKAVKGQPSCRVVLPIWAFDGEGEFL